MVKEKQPKVYIDKYKQKYGSANVPDTKNMPINNETKVSSITQDPRDIADEPSKVDKPIDYSNANELKARFSGREVRRKQMITNAKEIGDLGLVKTLETESREEAKQLEADISRIKRNDLIHEAMQRDLRRRELIDKHDAESESAFDEEFDNEY
jgi:hypothetical protein